MKKMKMLISIILICTMFIGYSDLWIYADTTNEMPENFVYIENLTPIQSDRYTGNMGDSFINKIGTRNGKTCINGITYEHGLEMWIARWNFMEEKSWAWATYSIPDGMNYLSGTLTFLNGSYNKSNFTSQLTIYGDQDILFQEEITQNTKTGIDVSISLDGYSTFTINVSDLRAVKGGTSFCLADAMLYKGDKDYQDLYKTHPVIMNYDSEFRESDVDVTVMWNMEYFGNSAQKFNVELAKAAAILANDAYYGSDKVYGAMNLLGIQTHHKTVNEYIDGINISKDNFDLALQVIANPVTYFGYQEIVIDDKKCNLFCVDVRGTSSNTDFLTDIIDGVNSFDQSCVNIKSDLVSFMKESTGKSQEELSNDNLCKNIFFITGHSLGAATSNRLSAAISEYASPSDIFAYTFESPHTCHDKDARDTENYAYNITNVLDIVPEVPWYIRATRYGYNWFYNSDKLNNDLYKAICGDGNVMVTPFWKSGVLGYHSMDLVLISLLQYEKEKEKGNINVYSDNYYLKLIYVACPVDVQIYDGEELICESRGKQSFNYNPKKAILFMKDDKKNIFFYADSEYTVRMNGTNTGTMEYVVYTYDFKHGGPILYQEFLNVALTDAKRFISTVDTTCIDILVDENILESSIELYVLDEDDQIIAEVLSDGSEIIYVKGINMEISKSMTDGDTMQLIASIIPDNSSNKILKWMSDNEEVAIVDNTGLVTAISSGTATITVTSTDGSNVCASCVITVEKKAENGETDSGSNSGSDTGNNSGNIGDDGNTSSGSENSGGASADGGSLVTGESSGSNTDNSGNMGDNENLEDSANNGNKRDVETVNSPDDSRDLTVKVLYYIVRFNANSGTKLSRSTMTLLDNDTIGILPKVQRKGYQFKGWYTKPTGGKKVTQKTVLNAATTLYAHWMKVSVGKIASLVLKPKEGGKVAISFKKVAGANGYVVEYSTDKRFKLSETKIEKTATTSVTLKGLKKETTYYIRIRAYKKDSSESKVYGKYSEVKKVKI